MARIVWSRSERDIVNEHLVLAFRQSPNISRKDAMRNAQKALPPARRAVVTDQRVFNYKMALESARARADEDRRRGSAREPEKAPEPAAPISIPAPATEARRDPTGGLAQVLQALLDAIADRVADRVAERVLLQLPEHGALRVPPAAHVPQSAIGSGKARPGVWLLGVQPAMGHHLREKYRERLDIDYLDSDEAARRLPSPRAHIVMMTRFVSHPVQERWKKSGRFHHCNGGLTALEGVLDSL